MKDGFVRLAAASPVVKIADCETNCLNIIEMIRKAEEKDASVVVFPELCVTGYTCGDLFLQSTLIEDAAAAVRKIAEKTADLSVISVVGFPFTVDLKLYNCAAIIFKGRVIAIIPKENIPSYSEFYEGRHFVGAKDENCREVNFLGEKVPFGRAIIKTSNFEEFALSAEICEDLWVPSSPSEALATEGATVIVNLSAGNEYAGKREFRKNLVKMQSAKLICAYAYASAGKGESTTDIFFSGDSMICENGHLISRSEKYAYGITFADVDLKAIAFDRRRKTSFPKGDGNINKIEIVLPEKELSLERKYAKNPFLPEDSVAERCDEILEIQSRALAARIDRIKAKSAVIGISGGLDSTLALIVTAKAFDLLEKDRKDIIALTMPCFGTTDRTKNNAFILAEVFGVTMREIPINDAVNLHFRDIGHSPDVRDTTYENAQARERTQILMDIANAENGLVVGTGDLSELALGFATYNGDHMSMYSVNASVPKTLMRHIIRNVAENSDEKQKYVLLDVLSTPVSPELLPHDGGKIAQKTEDIIGPYELHDFYLYYLLRYGFRPEKIVRIAENAFAGEFDRETIVKWLKIFLRRFFTQQFKRSCMPDGIKVGSISLSPRGDFRMPSDAYYDAFVKNL